MFECHDQIEIWGFCDQMETSQPLQKTHGANAKRQPLTLVLPANNPRAKKNLNSFLLLGHVLLGLGKS